MLSCLHCFCRECLNIEVGRQSTLKENRGEGPQQGREAGPQQIKGESPQQGREARPEQSKVERPHQVFNCPTCQKPVTIPVGGVRDLTQDLHLGIGVKIAQYQSKVASKDVVPCDVCIGGTSLGPAVGFCCSCHHFMCQLCCDHHKRARNFYQHDVIALGEAVPKERLSAVKPTCDLHNKEFVFYCETCSCLICHDCTTADHRDHIQSAKLPSIVATTRRDDIRKLLTCAQEVLSKLTDAFKGNITIMKEVEDNEEAVSKSIKQTFVRIHQALDDRMNKVLKQIHDFALSKKTALMLQKETFESLKQDLSRCVDIASCFHQNYTDCEIIALKQLPSTELQASINKAQNLSPEPCECSDIKVVFDNPLSIPDVCHLADICPEKSAWNSTCLRATRGSKYVLTVYAKDSNGQEYPYDDIQLKVELKPQGMRAAVLGDVERRSDGTYTISLVPVHEGPHLLNVTMNGEHVQLSPCKLQVKEPETTTMMQLDRLYRELIEKKRVF